MSPAPATDQPTVKSERFPASLSSPAWRKLIYLTAERGGRFFEKWWGGGGRRQRATTAEKIKPAAITGSVLTTEQAE